MSFREKDAQLRPMLPANKAALAGHRLEVHLYAMHAVDAT